MLGLEVRHEIHVFDGFGDQQHLAVLQSGLFGGELPEGFEATVEKLRHHLLEVGYFALAGDQHLELVGPCAADYLGLLVLLG